MVYGNFEIMKFKGQVLGSMQISGVGDKVVPLVRDVIRKEMKDTQSIVVHFIKNITHRGEFTESVANELREAIRKA